MWIVAKQGFISIVQHNEDETLFCVRARSRDDLAQFFPGQDEDIIELDQADYRFRMNVDRNQVIEVICDTLDDIDYTTHAKEAMSVSHDPARHSVYMDVWQALMRIQRPTVTRPGLRAVPDDDWEEWDDEEGDVDFDSHASWDDEDGPVDPTGHEFGGIDWDDPEVQRRRMADMGMQRGGGYGLPPSYGSAAARRRQGQRPLFDDYGTKRVDPKLAAAGSGMLAAAKAAGGDVGAKALDDKPAEPADEGSLAPPAD